MLHKLKSMAVIAAGGTLVFFGVGLHNGDEQLYKNLVMPLAHCLDAETAHRLGVVSLRLYGHLPASMKSDVDPAILKTKVWNMEFTNPIGLAAGFDKNGEAVAGAFKFGFGFVEVGSVTPQPQPGNPKPRVFRLFQDRAVINRYGFNSDGHDKVHKRLQNSFERNRLRNNILAVNLGKNKTSQEADDRDYEDGVKLFSDMAGFLVVNVSSPNTPGLRNLQANASLNRLLEAVIRARNSTDSTVPVLVKIAPDLTNDEKKDIAKVVLSKGIDGIVISNTTVTRPPTLTSPHSAEVGGLSGEPLKDMSTETIREMYILTSGKIPIIGVGGISSGKDAYE